MAKTLLLSIIIVALAFVLLGVKVLFVKGGKFPSGHVHSNPALTRRGISCATADDPSSSHHGSRNHINRKSNTI